MREDAGSNSHNINTGNNNVNVVNLSKEDNDNKTSNIVSEQQVGSVDMNGGNVTNQNTNTMNEQTQL